MLGGLLLGCWAGYCWGAGGGRALDIGFGAFPRVFEGSKKCTKAMRNTMRICDLGVSAWKPLGANRNSSKSQISLGIRVKMYRKRDCKQRVPKMPSNRIL